MTLFNPCIKAIGPPDAKIVLVGEAPGEQEEIAGIPFIGPSGQQLDSMLQNAGIKRSEVYLTNVLFTRPPNNKLDFFLIGRKELPRDYTLSPLRQGKYLHPDLLPEVQRLWTGIHDIKPNLIIAAGGTALWALTGQGGINKHRGAIHSSKWGKILPTLHPASILYDWSNRVLIQADLMKAAVEKEFPDVRRPSRRIHTDPTIEDLREWVDILLSASMLSIDCETKGGSITLLGFSPTISDAYIVPFYSASKPSRSYWIKSDELEVRKLCNRILSSPVAKLFQNGLYDLQYLLREGYQLRACEHDTMILHHAMYPELLKGLGFLGSLYTNEPSWKLMRQRGEDQLKREDE